MVDQSLGVANQVPQGEAMTPDQTDRLEVFLHAADEAGLQAGIDAVFRMGIAWAQEHPSTLHHRQAALYHRELEAVASMVGIAAERLRERNGRMDVCRARWLAMWLLRQRGRSFKAIGYCLHRDHSTVMNGVHGVEGDENLLARARELLARMASEEWA